MGRRRLLGASRIMKPRRFATVAAALCGTVVFAGWVITPPGFVAASIENTGAVPIEEQRAASLAADAELAEARQVTALDSAATFNLDVAPAAGSVTGTATDTRTASDGPESIVEAAAPETPPV